MSPQRDQVSLTLADDARGLVSNGGKRVISGIHRGNRFHVGWCQAREELLYVVGQSVVCGVEDSSVYEDGTFMAISIDVECVLKVRSESFGTVSW